MPANDAQRTFATITSAVFLASQAGHWYRPGPSSAFDLVPGMQGTRRRLQRLTADDQRAIAGIENLLSRCAEFGLEQSHAQGMVEKIQALVRENWRPRLRERGVDQSGIERLISCVESLMGDGVAL